jgi:NitT/TauT family transport system ATP-binding protein
LLLEVQRIWQETGKTIIFVTHNVREAAVLANRVLVMGARPGRIRAEIPVSAPRPRELRGVELLGVANRISDELAGEMMQAEQQERETAAASAAHHTGIRARG